MTNLDSLILTDRVKVTCANCSKEIDRTKRQVIDNRRKHGKDICISCAAILSISKKPQCSKEFWDNPERKQLHSIAIKTSEIHQRAMATIDVSGPKNGMFGKRLSAESRFKMSKSRIGKTGANATAWKGGKMSLMKRLKKILQTRFQWFSKVERDGGLCQHCGNVGRDAHHIKPISKIVKQLLIECHLEDETNRLEWLLTQPEIVDLTLTNGVCLCRACHKAAHYRWGAIMPSDSYTSKLPISLSQINTRNRLEKLIKCIH